MDKSESEILEEWDLVSSVCDSEQEKNQLEEMSENSNVTEISTSATSENKADATEKTSKSDIDSEKTIQDTLKTDEPVIVETVVVEKKAETEVPCEKEAVDEVEEAAIEGDTEEMSEPDTEEITVIETIMYDVKKISDVDSEKNIAANIEKISSAMNREGRVENGQGTVDSISKESDDNRTKECSDIKISDNKVKNADAELKANNDDLTSRNVNSSAEQPQSSSVAPRVYPVLTDPEMASLESSSSDIDIIDENIEDSISSSFLHPLSLSISSSADTSAALTPPPEEDKSIKVEEIRLPEESKSHSAKCTDHPKDSVEKSVSGLSYDYQYSSEKKENVHKRPQQRHRDAQSSIFGTILRIIQSLKCLEWSLIGSVMLVLSISVAFNQINYFSGVEKEVVVSQMKMMIDELKIDNKLLKDQMLSEMKNDKVFSSVEHQMKELRKENSRLNHMLHDVAKVLEKQKDSRDRYDERKENFLAPFKKEVNKLKEQINNLKIDNEDLQKQLVRTRYASYSQGGKDANYDKNKKKKEEIKTDETDSTDEIPIDINSLKKWNELISLLSKELGLSLESDPPGKEKTYSESRKNISWYWKVFLQDFKGKFDEFKANITSKFSDYKKVHENTVSDVYKFVTNFFNVEEQNNQQFIPPGEQSSRWNNFGDFFNDLKDKWSKIKNRIDTSDLKSFFNDLKMSGDDKTPQYESQKTKSSSYEHTERKPTNTHFESERKPSNVHFGSDRKHDKAQEDPENSKWMFERAAVRAELRETEKDDDVNWFLKKNKHLSEDDSEENKY